MKRRVHATAGILALTLIVLFFTSSVAVELLGDDHAVLVVKTCIVAALFLLVPSMAVTGASGRSLAGQRTAPLIRRKLRRMIAAASIGIVVLVPCAIALRVLAGEGDFGTAFTVIQTVELVGGATNITLLGLNVRDGRRLSGAAARRARNRAGVAVPRETTPSEPTR